MESLHGDMKVIEFLASQKVVRIISVSKYNSYTQPLFKELKLLKIMDVYKLNELNFFQKYTNNNIPHYIQILYLNPNNTIHGHNTRHQDNMHIKRENDEFAKNMY